MNLKLFTNKRQLWISIGKRVLITLVFVFVVVAINRYISEEIKALSTSAAEKRKVALILEKRSQLLEATKADLETVGNAAELIRRAYPPKENVLAFVDNLERLSTENSLIQSVKFGEPVPLANSPESFPVSRIDYTINLAGNSLNITNYIKQFENLPYASAVTGLNFTASASEGWNTSANAVITARLYVQ